MKFLKFMFDILIPRFVTEDVVVNWSDDDYEIVCTVADLLPGESHMGVCKITSFAWLGFGWAGRMEVPPRPFYNPSEAEA